MVKTKTGKMGLSFLEDSMNRIFCLCILGLGISACARIEGLTGGPKDTEPPQVIWEKSSSNLQTSFNPREIRLSFSEYIALNNIQQNLVITPTLQHNPKFRLKGKTLTIQLDENEVLRDNTTYVFQFGESVRDITERNPAKNLKFIFSTGEKIDSLGISGSVFLAETMEPAKNTLVSLYFGESDSAFTQRKPDLFTRTSDNGSFSVQYLKAGTYRLFALADNNQNLYYDLPDESFAFMNAPVSLDGDTSGPVNLFMSASPLPAKIARKTGGNGEVRLIFNRKVNSFEWQAESVTYRRTKFYGDSLILWYQAVDSVRSILSYDDSRDSLDLPPFKFDRSRPASFKAKIFTRLIKPNGQVKLECGLPVSMFNPEGIRTYPALPISVVPDSIDPSTLKLDLNTGKREKFYLVLDSACIQLVDGAFNQPDSLEYTVLKREALSTLLLRLQGLKPGISYLIQIREKKRLVHETFIEPSESVWSGTFSNLDPGKYQLYLIEDENKNKTWDPGSYPQRRQPEKISVWPMEELRPDWEIEQKITLE